MKYLQVLWPPETAVCEGESELLATPSLHPFPQLATPPSQFCAVVFASVFVCRLSHIGREKEKLLHIHEREQRSVRSYACICVSTCICVRYFTLCVRVSDAYFKDRNRFISIFPAFPFLSFPTKKNCIFFWLLKSLVQVSD